MSQQQTSGSSTTLPEAGTWTIDSAHSFVTFSVEHFTLALARGLATGPTGTVTIAPELGDSSVRASIDVSSIRTGNAIRDEKIQGPDVLDMEKYPTIDYASSGLKDLGGGKYTLEGSLTLHGITRPVPLSVSFGGVIVDTWGKERLGVTATGDIDRDEFGAGEWAHAPLAGGGFMVPSKVIVTLDIEATRDMPEG
ncbi:MAG: YceI family protein [Acidimicrobiaceae bacterium]|nr:YceI family protein [Acidimicrobiaceae bacterium]